TGVIGQARNDLVVQVVQTQRIAPQKQGKAHYRAQSGVDTGFMLDASVSARVDGPGAGGARHYLMCPPEFFTVAYRINPSMDPARAVDPVRARDQWRTLHTAYLEAGHKVETIAPKAGLPDMVFAANSALVLDGTAYLARFRYAQRTGEEPLY